MFVVNSRGQIIADLGLRWLRYLGDEEYWSPRTSYRIEKVSQKSLLWRLYRKSSKSFIADTTIFIGHTVDECMRVAEIYEIRRGN